MSCSEPPTVFLSATQEKRRRREEAARQAAANSSSFCIRYGRRPMFDPELRMYRWVCQDGPGENSPEILPKDVFERLNGGIKHPWYFRTAADAIHAADQAALRSIEERLEQRLSRMPKRSGGPNAFLVVYRRPASPPPTRFSLDDTPDLVIGIAAGAAD